MNKTNENDVPSPIDFHDLEQARIWEKETVENRPSRPKFFAEFARALNKNFDAPINILELGSGPGHLAQHVLMHCIVTRYTALDFSNAMHALARERLQLLAEKVNFATRDFSKPDWGDGLGSCDAILTMQAAHETRHKRHLPTFLRACFDRLGPGGLLLYCDHYFEAGSAKNDALYASSAEQSKALARAGFVKTQLLLDEGGMALFEGHKP